MAELAEEGRGSGGQRGCGPGWRSFCQGPKQIGAFKSISLRLAIMNDDICLLRHCEILLIDPSPFSSSELRHHSKFERGCKTQNAELRQKRGRDAGSTRYKLRHYRLLGGAYGRGGAALDWSGARSSLTLSLMIRLCFHDPPKSSRSVSDDGGGGAFCSQLATVDQVQCEALALSSL